MGDEEIVAPYCTHKETGDAQYLKSGLIGFIYRCEILVIDRTPESVESLGQQIMIAIEALGGTTTSGTKIDMVEFQGDEPDFDIESKLYLTILTFLIETSNR